MSEPTRDPYAILQAEFEMFGEHADDDWFSNLPSLSALFGEHDEDDDACEQRGGGRPRKPVGKLASASDQAKESRRKCSQSMCTTRRRSSAWSCRT